MRARRLFFIVVVLLFASAAWASLRASNVGVTFRPNFSKTMVPPPVSYVWNDIHAVFLTTWNTSISAIDKGGGGAIYNITTGAALAAAKVGTGARFSANNTQVQAYQNIAYTSTLPQTLWGTGGDWTIDYWVNYAAAATSADHVYVNTSPSFLVYLYIRVSGANQMNVKWQNNAGTGIVFNSSVPVAPGGWHHYAFRYTRTPNTLDFFLDGVQQGGTQPGGGIPILNTEVVTLTWGFFSTGVIAGTMMDEVRLSNVARTNGEIAFAATAARP